MSWSLSHRTPQGCRWSQRGSAEISLWRQSQWDEEQESLPGEGKGGIVQFAFAGKTSTSVLGGEPPVIIKPAQWKSQIFTNDQWMKSVQKVFFIQLIINKPIKVGYDWLYQTRCKMSKWLKYFGDHLCSLLIGRWWLHISGRGAWGRRPLCLWKATKLSQSLLLLALSSPELS